MDASLDRSRALQLIRESSAEIGAALNQLDAEWYPEEPPLTIQFSAAARAVAIAMRQSPQRAARPLAVAEELLVSGEDDVKDAVATGFLETLLVEVDSGSVTYSSVDQHLGLRCRDYCKNWNRFTGATTDEL